MGDCIKEYSYDGDIRYSNKDCLIHRIDGPAYLSIHGRIEYYQNGKLHRTDGPAVIFPDGTEAYYENGKRHRENGPAIINEIGDVYYYENDTLTKEIRFDDKQ